MSISKILSNILKVYRIKITYLPLWYKKRKIIRNWFSVWLKSNSNLNRIIKLLLNKPLFDGVCYRFNEGYRLYIPIDKVDEGPGIENSCQYYLNNISSYYRDYSHVNGDILIDIGAHVGTFSIPIAFKYPNLSLFSYEADQANFNLLNKNITLNKLNKKNIKTFNLGIYDRSGVKTFSNGTTSTTGSIKELNTYKYANKKKVFFKTKSEKTIVTTALEDEFIKYSIDECKLIKMDCEGSEYKILLYLPQKVLKKIKYLIIEAHPTKVHKPIELRNFLEINRFVVMEKKLANGCCEFYCKNKRY